MSIKLAYPVYQQREKIRQGKFIFVEINIITIKNMSTYKLCGELELRIKTILINQNVCVILQISKVK